MPDDLDCLILCRPGLEEALVHEAAEKSASSARVAGPGGVLISEALEAPYIFERQRLEDAQRIPLERLKPISDEDYAAILGQVITYRQPWALLTSPMDSSDGASNKRVEGIANTLLRLCRKKDPDIHDRMRKDAFKLRKPHCLVLQLCLGPEGLWHAATRLDAMIDLHPGGIRRMSRDANAPSRSYLKIEEAFARLGIEPQAGETVVDLGAAPGGWSWAFLRRGCRVTAVDNGPMQVEADPETGASLEHLREDGVTYRPGSPVDWMVSDMLVPPGMAVGLLRRWLQPEPLMKRFVCNIKIPQQQPYAGLRGVERFLSEQDLPHCEMRQLYHDRREVTVFGETRTE